MVAAMLAVHGLLAGRRVLEAAPTQQQTDAFWRYVRQFTAPLVQAKLAEINRTLRTVEMVGGGRICCKTAWDADTLRGDYADLLILDEYALMDPSAWEEVGLPMLLDNNGDALFIFTPKRRNHAFRLMQKALTSADGRWAAWHCTSQDNPYLPREALAEVAADMSEEMYRQEILAEFLEGEGAVFRNVEACLVPPGQDSPATHHGHAVVAGVDWGKHEDFTAVSVFCAVCNRELAIARSNQVDYLVQKERIRQLALEWAVGFILAEANAMGEPIIEAMQAEGLPVQGWVTTPANKSTLIEALALAFERGSARWLANEVWTAELHAYEYVVGRTGRVRYSAPDDMHDDTVIARALAWQAAAMVKRPSGILVYEEPLAISAY